jgi:uroporphyrinogen-III synthase
MSDTSPQPLAGRRVVVTRTREQASILSARLAALGAEVIELPVLRISKEISKQALADVMLELGSYDWIVFTSGSGVHFFFEEFMRIFDDIRSLGLIRVACVGEATARGIAEFHLKVECCPKTATAEDLAEALIATGSLENSKVLVITGNLNRDTLVRRLEEARAIVDRLQVYKTEQLEVAELPAAADYREKGADAVLFASSSSAQSFHDQAGALKGGPAARKPLYGSIGPQTSATMRKCGIPVDFEAKPPGFDELVSALVKKLRSRKDGGSR